MTEKPMAPEAGLYEAEEIAAEWLIEQGEVALEDRCDLLDAVGDGELADHLIEQATERIDEHDFERLRWSRGPAASPHSGPPGASQITSSKAWRRSWVATAIARASAAGSSAGSSTRSP